VRAALANTNLSIDEEAAELEQEAAAYWTHHLQARSEQRGRRTGRRGQ